MNQRACDEGHRELYPDVERVMERHLERGARRLQQRLPRLDVDDAKQEARVAMLAALPHYDPRKANGDEGLRRYLSRVVANTYRALLQDHLLKRNAPHSHVRADDGGWIKVPRPILSYDEMLSRPETAHQEPVDPERTPEQQVIEAELDGPLRTFRERLFDELDERERIVLGAQLDETTRGGYAELAGRLGVTKNAIDWSLHKARKVATKLAKRPEFRTLFGEYVESKAWPIIHESWSSDSDQEYVDKVLEERRLDGETVAPMREEVAGPKMGCGGWHWRRRVGGYRWGVVLMLRKGAEACTLVVEGRCNLITGDVYSESGARDELPVPWYGALVRALKTGVENATR